MEPILKEIYQTILDFEILDLGADVSSEKSVAAADRVDVIALSALPNPLGRMATRRTPVAPSR
jgi:cobalamin-dependent methionine synthase I